jgi:nitroreductase
MDENRLTNNDHPIHDLLRRRWSPRAFSERSVEPAVLARLFEAARWAASSYNEQPWAFIVATKEQPEQFARILGCLVEFNRTWARSAPVLMLTVAHMMLARNRTPNRHAFYDVGQAMGQLTVQATAEGLSVHQMAGILPPLAQQAFAIPEGWEAVTGVAIGYAGDPARLSDELRKREEAPRERKKLSEFVFINGWGQATAF